MQSYGIFLNLKLPNILIFSNLNRKLLNFSELQRSLAVHNWVLPANRHKKLHKQCLWSDKYKMKNGVYLLFCSSSFLFCSSFSLSFMILIAVALLPSLKESFLNFVKPPLNEDSLFIASSPK